MKRKRRLSHKLGGLAAGVFLLVAVVYVVRLPEMWLVRTQMRAAVGGRLIGWVDDQSAVGQRNERALEARLAARYPDDFLVQMAVALRNIPPGSTKHPASDMEWPLDALAGQEARSGSAAAERLRELTKRFKTRPELYAAILRNMARSEVGLNNRLNEQNALVAVADPTLPSTSPNLNSTRALYEWDEACYQGERLDPGNAFFPAMRAVGLYARHEDDPINLAEAHLERAGRAPFYNDYATLETEAQWRLMALKAGDGGHAAEPGAVPRLGEYAGLCYWHIPALHQLARLATSKAMQNEKYGDRADGFRLRRAVAHLGATMRADAKGGFVTPLAGASITETSCLRSGGAPSISDEGTDESGDRWAEERRAKHYAAYKAFLLRTGHGGEAQFIEEEASARVQMNSIYRQAQTLPGNEADLRSYWVLCALWAGGIGLLSNALVVTLAGGLAALYCRAAPHLARYVSVSPRGKSIWIAAHMAGFALVGAGLLALGDSGGARTAFGFGCGLMGLSPRIHDQVGVHLVVGAVSVLGALAPLIALLAFCSWRRKIPLSVGIARGLVRRSVPVALGLLTLYAGVAGWTMREEAARTYQLQRTVQAEGPYYAERLGIRWPGLEKQNEGIKP